MKFVFQEIPDGNPFAYDDKESYEKILNAEPIELPPLGCMPRPNETIALEVDGVHTVFLITNVDYNIDACLAVCTLMGKRVPYKTGIDYARRP